MRNYYFEKQKLIDSCTFWEEVSGHVLVFEIFVEFCAMRFLQARAETKVRQFNVTLKNANQNLQFNTPKFTVLYFGSAPLKANK